MLSASRKAPTEANGKEAGVEPGADKGKVVDAEIPIKDPTSEVLAALAAASAANNSEVVRKKGGREPITNKSPWTKEEDELVVKLVQEYGDKSWVVIAPHVKTRTAKQIRERWHNHLDSNIKKGPWTPEEDQLIILAQRLHGNRFAEIAKMVPGRTDNAIKNRWHATLRRLIRRERNIATGKLNADGSSSKKKQAGGCDPFQALVTKPPMPSSTTGFSRVFGLPGQAPPLLPPTFPPGSAAAALTQHLPKRAGSDTMKENADAATAVTDLEAEAAAAVAQLAGMTSDSGFKFPPGVGIKQTKTQAGQEGPSAGCGLLSLLMPPSLPNLNMDILASLSGPQQPDGAGDRTQNDSAKSTAAGRAAVETVGGSKDETAEKEQNASSTGSVSLKAEVNPNIRCKTELGKRSFGKMMEAAGSEGGAADSSVAEEDVADGKEGKGNTSTHVDKVTGSLNEGSSSGANKDGSNGPAHGAESQISPARRTRSSPRPVK